MGIMDRFIPGLIFQAKATKLGTHIGLNMLIDISSEFNNDCKEKIL